MMNFTQSLKGFIKLFPLFLIAMLGTAHSATEGYSLINHTKVFVFGFKYEPTLWSFLAILFVTITAALFSLKVILNIGKSSKKDS